MSEREPAAVSAAATAAYFSAATGDPIAPGRYCTIDDLASVEVAPGLRLRPLVGNGMMLSFARYAAGAEAPRHAHAEEQMFVALEGEFEIDLDGDVRTVRPGEAVHIPAWVPHRVTAGAEPAYQLDVFSPPRQGLLDLLADAAPSADRP
jgi:quercetin dioxygenase-like cupin family protein